MDQKEVTNSLSSYNKQIQYHGGEVSYGSRETIYDKVSPEMAFISASHEKGDRSEKEAGPQLPRDLCTFLLFS